MQPYHRAAASVSDIKAKFEAKKTTSPEQQPQQEQNTPSTPANMNPSAKRAGRHLVPQPSIDTVLDSVPANAVSPAATRPHTSKHPSWVGPKPPGKKDTPTIAAMKQPVTVTFSSPGLRPPVFISTDLTDPQWEPTEMDSEQTDKGEYTFAKTFNAEEGEYQYKLRLGPGDWWICDDSKPKVDDGAGNENNLLVVIAEAPAPPPPEIKEPQPQPVDKAGLPVTPAVEDPGPLFGHETLAPAQTPAPTEDDDDGHHHDAPLLRHESIAPSSQEQNHSPLFRHESMAIDDKHHDEIHGQFGQRRKSSSDSIPEEADPHDPSLEKFPTDHNGIMEHLDRARNSMQADETSDEPRSPSHSPANSAVASVSPSLPSVREDGDAELEVLREEEEAEAEKEIDESLSPDADVPVVRVMEVDVSDIPAAPITPPMTPKEQDEDKELVDSPMNVRQKASQIKEKAKEKATQAKQSAIPAMAIVLSLAAALVSAGVAWYVFKAGDNVVQE